MRTWRLLLSFTMPLTACWCGCAPSVEGPSYAELVTIYNAELEVLERLERKREQLIANYEAATKPPPPDTVEALQGVLESATEALQQSADEGDVFDPQQLLDRVADEQGKAEQLAGELRGVLTGEAQPQELSPEQQQQQEELKREFDTQLATLDAEIATQKELVEKARAARDAAQ